MSGASGTSRANSRNSKDKTTKTNATQNSKTDGLPSKMQVSEISGYLILMYVSIISVCRESNITL